MVENTSEMNAVRMDEGGRFDYMDAKLNWRGEPVAFKSTFDTPFDQYAEYHGMKFEALSKKDLDEVHSVEAGLMGYLWRIRLENGRIIEAWPEEVEAGIDWDANPNGQRSREERLRVSYGVK